MTLQRLIILCVFTLCVSGSALAGAAPANAAKEQLKTQYDEAFKSLKDDDEAGYQKLAQWCDTNKLKTEAENLWASYNQIVVRKKRAELEKKPVRTGYTALIDYCNQKNMKPVAEELTHDLLLFDYREQKAKLKPDDVKGLLVLAKFCSHNSLTEESNETLRAIIALQPDHAEARAELGYYKIDNKWQTEEELGKAFVAAAPADRDALYAAWQKAGYKNSRTEMDKFVVWAQSPTGKLRNQKVPGYTQDTAWYHLNVPAEYGAFKPALPLVIFLHGGGTGNGSADQIVAMGEILASMSDCIVLFPNHINDWWATPAETSYFLTSVGDVLKNYRVDPRRIYLMGASMGGNGTWSIGTHYAELFAAISPSAAFWEGRLGFPMRNLISKPVYVIHGANDHTVPVDCSRKATEVLKKQGTNYIYAELDCDHQCPDPEYEKGLKWMRHYTNKQPYKFEDLLARAKKNAGAPQPKK